jgi:hypothetical protein
LFQSVRRLFQQYFQVVFVLQQLLHLVPHLSCLGLRSLLLRDKLLIFTLEHCYSVL